VDRPMGIGQWERAFSMSSRCARILARNRDAIDVRKDHLAIANLARIVEATLRLANKQTFPSTSMRDLAKGSGLSMGGLYSYVANKSMLLSMILGEVVATVDETLAAPPAEVRAEPRAHLRWIIGTHIRLSEAMQPWFVFCFMEAKSFPAAERSIALDAEAMTERLIAEAIGAGIAAGAFALDEVGLSASLVKPLLQDWYVKRAKYRRRGVTIDDYIAAVTAFVEGALTVRPSPVSLVAPPRRARSGGDGLIRKRART
jgi:AcrR family transcriptional regulator